ncbi:hypothetical protein EG328_006101 [Venturia inaequalis]|uniref:Uncharacterized protein n=1 Tax=Venturia inaequalis TaxID=5025 RepID=A0A8H3UJT4_VENIN|nr:hypothetical protein EG328_006101 [Venturia inaequalis]KAE9993529.1 hypothetical protein EG327_004540 [Venturia inaequalis]
MKPVVSAMSAWSCIVISAFAIVILSVIGALFKSNNHTMMGSTDDPKDGAAVAATVFAAVAVYGSTIDIKVNVLTPLPRHKSTCKI